MPVDFLTDEQAQRYGRFSGDPTPAQLARYFYLNDSDRRLISNRRRDFNRLGFAIQLCTVRFLGTFLSNPIKVPKVVIKHLAIQLSISDMGCLKHYVERVPTYRQHSIEIQQFYGYQDFNEQPEHFRLVRWLYTRAWLSTERPIVLFDLVTARLAEKKILLPGVTVLTKLIARIRERASARLWSCLAKLPSVEQRSRLDALLIVPEGTRISSLDRLRRAPTRISSPSMTDALNRLVEIRSLGGRQIEIGRIPPGRLKVLARYAAAAWAANIARMPADRRIASLISFAHVYEGVAQDDAIDLLNQLITQCLSRADNKGEKERLRTIHNLDIAAIRLGEVCKIVLDPKFMDEELRTAIFKRVGRKHLEEAVATVDALTRSEDNYYDFLIGNYSTIRRFLPLLLETIAFEGTQASQPVLKALDFLREIEGHSKPDMEKAPTELINKAWKKLVIQPDGKIDRRFYTFCILENLQDGLARRDIFVNPSERWGNPRAKLLQGPAWEAARPKVCLTLNLSPTAEPELEKLAKQLDEAYRRVAANLPNNPDVVIEKVDGKDRLSLSPLDKLDEPPSLILLRDQVDSLIPPIDITDAVLEMHGYTGFADEFYHISESNARVKNLALSICAVLTAEACNTGIEPFVDPNNPALTYARLAWVQQNYMRAENIVRGNARLVNAQARIPLAQAFGGGEVASADGLRFVVPVRTLNAGPNSKYFHVERGVTYYNFVSDQYSGFHGIVIPGTLHDSAYVLDGLLENLTDLEPKELMTDTAGYSDIVFGAFWLSGFQFSPRLADMGEARFWRFDRKADYGPLNGLSQNILNPRLMSQNWDDALRGAGSLKMGVISASELIRSLQRGTKRSMMARAFGEIGRIPKTLHMLRVMEDPVHRRRILTQLNRGEGRNGLGRKCFHGKRGELRQRYREGQEDQLGALGLVMNALILWNTRYMDAALNHLRSQGAVTKPEDIARLSPLRNKHFNVLGRYRFNLTDSILKGKMRPLRNPDTSDDYLWDSESEA
ncbi:MAG: Tn3 family transposase [Nitrospiria bacterium]